MGVGLGRVSAICEGKDGRNLHLLPDTRIPLAQGESHWAATAARRSQAWQGCAVVVSGAGPRGTLPWCRLIGESHL